MADKGGRRLVSVLIDMPFLQEIMEEGYSTKGKTIVCEKGIPPGANFLGAFYDFETYTTHLVFEHSSFEPVPEGTRVPRLSVVHRTEGEC